MSDKSDLNTSKHGAYIAAVTIAKVLHFTQATDRSVIVALIKCNLIEMTFKACSSNYPVAHKKEQLRYSKCHCLTDLLLCFDDYLGHYITLL